MVIKFKVCLKMKKLVSFVVPVYNEEENLHEFHKRMSSVMEALPYDYELIFVDDGSADSSHLILAELAEQDEHVQVYFWCIFYRAITGTSLR